MLLDLDLHFGTVALKLDTDPGSGLCEALEQPSRIDALFVDRATVKVTDTLRVLAAEASVAETLIVDAGAIDVLLYELRRKFAWVVVDLPRWVTPTQRVVLGRRQPRRYHLRAQSRRVARHDPPANADCASMRRRRQVLLVEAGAAASAPRIGKAEFEKAVGKTLRRGAVARRKSAAAATNAGQPLPVAAPRSPVVREAERLAVALRGAGIRQKRKIFGLTIR